MLKIDHLNVNYGQIHALKDVSLEVHTGEIVALIGANGAGKSTLLLTISGIIKSSSGSILYDCNIKNKKTKKEEPTKLELTKIKPHEIVKLKLSQVPEGRQIFQTLSVNDNLDMGAYIKKNKETIKQLKEKMFGLFPRLKERRYQIAGTLSGGEQQMLAIARALMSEPKLLLLDEPSMGLSPLIVKEVFQIIKTVNKEGITILLVEQNAKMALSIADRGYVVENGKVVLEGKGKELLINDNVKKAYLGK